MNILEVLIRLRDDLKLWVTNNLLALKEEIDSKSTFSGSYNDLTDIPNIDGQIDEKINEVEAEMDVLEAEIDTLQSDVLQHSNNADIHVTKTEKDGWSDHAIDSESHVTTTDKYTWNEHVGNNDIHVTEEQKIRWTNKSDFSGDYNDLKNAPDIKDDGLGDLKFVDELGNIIFQIDENGIHTTNVEAVNNVTAKNIEAENISINGNDVMNIINDTVNNTITEVNNAIEEVVQVDVIDGVLTLALNKYQKTNMVDGTQIIFPTLDKFIEIHLYFSADSNMNIEFPDCKWRVEPNIEEGNSYEIIAVYNTIEWLVNVVVYS